MATINAGSIILGDVIRLNGIKSGTNGVVEKINKDGSTVSIRIRCNDTGQSYSYNIPYSSRFEKVINIIR